MNVFNYYSGSIYGKILVHKNAYKILIVNVYKKNIQNQMNSSKYRKFEIRNFLKIQNGGLK